MPSSLLTVFFLPLAVLLGFPYVYRFLLNGSYSPHDEAQLQELASLMESIYTTLADMTFIPHASIKRGPHYINASAIPCTLSPSVIRLMELLPYVDTSLVQTPDWIFGGEFIDFRRSDHLNFSSCDPLRGSSIGWTEYMSPNSIALTDWGTGGWNGDQTWVMLYDVETQAIRVHDGEWWIDREQVQSTFETDFEELYSNTWDSKLLDDSFSTLKMLTAVRDRYHTLKWTPWETSRKERGFGVPPDLIRKLLLQNGWRKTFSAQQFNADFIRARHKPSGRGHAEQAYKEIERLKGHSSVDSWDNYRGSIWWREKRVAEHQKSLKSARDEDERLMYEWHVQNANWDLERDRADLKAAERDAEQLCPKGVCVAPEDLILWEFRSLERAYEKSLHMNQTRECNNRLFDLYEYAPPDPTRFESCLDQTALENHWLHLAYRQSKAEALKHCESTGCELLVPDTMESRAKAKIAQLEGAIMRDEDRMRKMEVWQHRIPENAERTWLAFEIDHSPTVNGRWYMRDEIERIKGELEQGGDKLWARLDDDEEDD